jgi:predicted Zn-dependent protease
LIRVSYDWDWAAADAAFQRALALDPGDVRPCSAPDDWRWIRRMDDADPFQGAVARSPVNPEAHMWLGDGYAMSNRLDDAEREMRTSLRLSPGYAGGWFRLGAVLIRMGQGEAALEAMKKEQAENWRLPGLALAYIALNREAEADAALEEAIDRQAGTMAFQIAELFAYRRQGSGICVARARVSSARWWTGVVTQDRSTVPEDQS